MPLNALINFDSISGPDADDIRVSLLAFRDKAKLFSYDLYRKFDSLIENKVSVDMLAIVKQFRQKYEGAVNRRPYRQYVMSKVERGKLARPGEMEILEFLRLVKDGDHGGVLLRLHDNVNYVKGVDHIGLGC